MPGAYAARLSVIAAVILAVACAALPAGCGGGIDSTGYLFFQSAAGGSLEAGNSEASYTLTLTGVSPRTVRFADRPRRAAGTLSTGSFVAAWPRVFEDSEPNAVLAFAETNEKGQDSAVFTVSEPVYDRAAGTLTYRATEVLDGGKEVAVDAGGHPLKALPEQFAAATLFIDSGELDPEDMDAASPRQYYGMCFGDWVKTRQSYDAPPNTFIDLFLGTIAPCAQWITTYRVDWSDLNYAIRQAHSHGLRVAACAGVTWTAAGPDPSNQQQVSTLIDLVNQGFVDMAIVGNEPEGNRGNPAYPMDRMAADLVGYINQVKSGTGGKVKVGTRLIGVIGDDPAFKTIVQACDVVQVNIHPAEFAANGNNITIDQALQRLKNDYAAAKAHMQSWGRGSIPLQVGETGWPTSDNPSRPGYVPGLFTAANAARFRDGVLSWASQEGVAVFWFEAADEPAKSNYDMKHYSANWGVWHWTPDNPAVPFVGRFQQKY